MTNPQGPATENADAKKKFYHPYSPYDIQLEFMKAVYDCLEDGKVGVFESPTGTGKSLSLICGSFTWLREHKRKRFSETLLEDPDSDEPAWMLEYSKKEKARRVTEKWKELESRLAKIRAAEEKRRKESEKPGKFQKKLRVDTTQPKAVPDEDTQFELEDYESDTEGKGPSAVGIADDHGLSVDTLALLDRFSGKFSNSKRSEEDEDEEEIKIFYCSRTHSQLSQFSRELERVHFPSSLPPHQEEVDVSIEPGEQGLEEGIKHLSLGSRKTLCINPGVAALGNTTAINERCMELQQPSTPANQKCPFLPSKENEGALLDFRDHTLAKIRDIEDIGSVGRQLAICPYYASRQVIKHSEIITLPYPLLIQRSAREALNLSVKDHIVIIDEAHNLMDAIAGIYSTSVSLQQLQTAVSQLTGYARRYRLRLKGKNRIYITQVMRLLSSIIDCLKTVAEKEKNAEGIVHPSDLMSGKGVDQINTYKLSRYLTESKLARKVEGFSEHMDKKEHKDKRTPVVAPVLFQVQSFILSLMNPSKEGKFFFSKLEGNLELKYVLLDPTNHFREITEDARAVILAGGTMSPMSDYSKRLFSYLPTERLQTFSFGHVIPAENLTAQVLGKGFQKSEFNFTFEARYSDQMINDLGHSFIKLCEIIPDGVVAFFPSYDYLRHVVDKWKKSQLAGSTRTILSQIGSCKSLFYETLDQSTNAEDMLQEYSKTVDSGSGALLLSVVGGKLSEGINFSDKLGRAVFIVGLPFPNIRSAVWQAKIQHIEKTAYEQNSTLAEGNRKAAAKAEGRDFYENACMRAVNQCIGRAIRHRNDYAAIILMDKRYSTERIQAKLPGWIKRGLATNTSTLSASQVQDNVKSFFDRW